MTKYLLVLVSVCGPFLVHQAAAESFACLSTSSLRDTQIPAIKVEGVFAAADSLDTVLISLEDQERIEFHKVVATDHAEVDATYRPRSPRYKNFFRYIISEDEDSGDNFQLFLPKENQDKKFLAYLRSSFDNGYGVTHSLSCQKY